MQNSVSQSSSILSTVGPNKTPEKQKDMYNLCGLIDLQLKKLFKNSIFLVGLTRVGKSTVFNYINNKNLIGVRKNGKKTIFYGIQIEDAQAALTSPDIKSVTLLPNIVEKQSNGDKFTLADMAGYGDQRRYPEVVSVSYVLKAAFQIVDRCKFGLVASKQSFSAQNSNTLFKNILGFVNMFQFNLITDQTKQNILKSCTIIITKTDPNQQDRSLFANEMKMLAEQIQDEGFGALATQQIQNIAQILNYFSKNENQIYLFDKAIMNKPAPKCTLMQKHFDVSPYFQSRNQNNKFRQNHSRSIFRTPYNEDIDNMPKASQKIQLQEKLKQKFKSFDQMAKIMLNFFKKAIDQKNYFSPNIDNSDQFKKVKLFNQKYNVYPQYNFISQSTLKNKFSPDQTRKIQNGIQLALNVFNLYERFKNLPDISNSLLDQKLAQYMDQYKAKLIEILKLFRDSFCSSYSEQLLIQEFVFVAVRGCRQFSMLYQIKAEGRQSMCKQLKDSFASILNDTPLQDIQQNFIKQLYAKREEVIKQSKHTQCQIYLKYFKDVANKYMIIKESFELKQLRRLFLDKIGAYVQLPEDKLTLLFQNLLQQTAKTSEVIDKLQQADASGWQDKFPQQRNFTIKSLLSRIGHILLELSRPNQLQKDKFAFNNLTLKGKQNVKQKLNQTQFILAKDIFLYIKCVQSAKQAYQAIINNYSNSEIKKKLQYKTGLAKYLAKNAKPEQAIGMLQQAQKLSYMHNCFTEYQQIKKDIQAIQNEKQTKNKIYFKDLKKKKIIDPTDDQDLIKIIEQLKIKFIQPYEKYKQMKQQQEQKARKNAPS